MSLPQKRKANETPFGGGWRGCSRETRLHIWTFCHGEDLGNVAQSCRTFRDDIMIFCDNPLDGTRVAELSCTSGSAEQLATVLRTNRHKFIKFQSLRLINHHCILPLTSVQQENQVSDVVSQLPTVTRLQLMPTPPEASASWIATWIPKVLPHLVEVDYSRVHSTGTITELAKRCPDIQVLRWDDCPFDIHCTGYLLHHFANLRELHLNHCCFQLRGRPMMKCFFVTPQHEGPCLLHQCNARLERVSLVGANYRDVWGQPTAPQPFTQVGLVKFVRQTPNLRWFRSDLNAENVAMLQREFPHILFCS